MKRLLILLPLLLASFLSVGQEDQQYKKIIYEWWLSGSQEVVYDSDYQVYLDQLTTEGFTHPDGLIKAIQNQLVIDLKAAGLWIRAKTINIYGFGSIGAGLVNMKSPLTHKHIVVGTVVFTEGSGVKSNSTISGGYIRTAYAINQYAGIESDLTSVLYISESSTDIAATMYAYGARGNASSANTGVAIRPLSGATSGVRVGYGAAGDSFTNNNHQGLYVLYYENPNSVIRKDGVEDNQAITPTAPDISNEVLLLSRNIHASGGISSSESYPHNVMSLFRFDRFSDADEASFRAIWNNYIASLPTLIHYNNASITWNSASIRFNTIYTE
jgi:hypothetical protein